MARQPVREQNLARPERSSVQEPTGDLGEGAASLTQSEPEAEVKARALEAEQIMQEAAREDAEEEAAEEEAFNKRSPFRHLPRLFDRHIVDPVPLEQHDVELMRAEMSSLIAMLEQASQMARTRMLLVAQVQMHEAGNTRPPIRIIKEVKLAVGNGNTTAPEGVVYSPRSHGERLYDDIRKQLLSRYPDSFRYEYDLQS